MLVKLRQDRISQFLAIIIIGLLVIACLIFGWSGYLVLNRPPQAGLETITPAFKRSIGDNLIIKNPQTEYTQNHLKIWGEVENAGEYDCPFVEISVSYYNATGDLIISDFNYLDRHNLPPGEKSSFIITTPRPLNSSVPTHFSLSLSNTFGCIRSD